MPMVKIEILEGKTSEYKKSVLNGVKAAVKDAVVVDEIVIVQRLYEISAETCTIPSDRSENLTMIEITLYPGRPESTKKKLFDEIVKNLSKEPGIEASDIIIVLLEPPMENWMFKYEN
ncbi:MAG: tautomerase family protein [Methanobacterium sp.]|nr:tautomerase family protein [Methanobacterium sp.]